MKDIYLFLKKHATNYRAIICCVLLIFITSCGIPTVLIVNDGVVSDQSYYEFSSSVDSSTSISTNLKFNLIDDSFQVNQSPSLVFFYSICPTSIITETTFSNKIETEFNSTYSHQYPGRRFNISKDDPYLINVENNSNNYKLYKFTYNELEQLPLEYISTLKSLEYGKDYDVNFQIVFDSINNNFMLSETTSPKFFKTLSNNNYIDSEDLILQRAINKENFINSNIEETDLDYLSTNLNDLNNSNTTYKVIVFCAMTIEGDFSNIFWSNLHKVGSFEL